MKHKWKFAGKDTGGIVEWCSLTGAIKDSAGNITYAQSYKELELMKNPCDCGQPSCSICN